MEEQLEKIEGNLKKLRRGKIGEYWENGEN